MLIVLLKTHFPGWYIVRRAGEGGGGGSIQKETITHDFLFNIVNNWYNQETLIIQRSQWKKEKSCNVKLRKGLHYPQRMHRYQLTLFCIWSWFNRSKIEAAVVCRGLDLINPFRNTIKVKKIKEERIDLTQTKWDRLRGQDDHHTQYRPNQE